MPLVSASLPVPRKSPEYAIELLGGKQILLSSYRGKVVLLEFLLTTCPHCQRAAQTISALNTELGPKGFQPLGVAVNPDAAQVVGNFINQFKPNFPVGYSKVEPMMVYMGLNPVERWVVPQIVLIDKKGQIRYQTPPQGDEQITDARVLRAKIQELLNEPGGAPARSPGAKPAAKKPSAKATE